MKYIAIQGVHVDFLLCLEIQPPTNSLLIEDIQINMKSKTDLRYRDNIWNNNGRIHDHD